MNNNSEKGTDNTSPRKFGSQQIIPVCTAVISAGWIVYGLKEYGYWDQGTTPGFLPVTVAGIMLVASIFAIAESVGLENTAKYLPESFLLLFCGFCIWGASFLIGTLPSLLLFFVLWLKLFEKTSWKTIFFLTMFMAVLIIGVFVLWLRVPFEQGMILKAILY